MSTTSPRQAPTPWTPAGRPGTPQTRGPVGPSGPSGGPGGPAGGPPPERPVRRSSGGQVLAIILGVLLLLLGTGGVGAGTAILVARAVGDGFVTSPAWAVGSAGHAVVVGEVELSTADVPVRWPQALLGQLRVRATGGQEEVFLGIARARDAAAYLSGVAHTEMTGNDRWVERTGGPPPVAPARARIWLVAAGGPGTQEVTTTFAPGTWVAVVMNPDGSRPVVADLDVGLAVPTWVALVPLLVGAVLLLGGLALMVVGLRRS